MGNEDPAPKKRKKRRAEAAADVPEATPAVAPTEGARPRKALAAGGTLLPLGLALVGIGPSELGMGITLLSLVVLIYGVHSFGRLGPA